MKSERKDNDILDFKVLKDEHLKTESDDKFGYGSIADSLFQVINKVEPPFTIGLYGQWGLGKSSICGIIQSKIEKAKKHKVFYFDTWKYQKDSFRRQFLIELDDDLFDGKLKFKRRLNQSLSLPEDVPFFELLERSFKSNIKTFSVKVLVPLLAFVTIGGLAAFLVTWLFSLSINQYFDSFDTLLVSLNEVVWSIFGIGVIATLAKSVFNSVHTSVGTVSTPRTDSAEGFEYYFKEVLDKLTGTQKLVIIIDNLDRVEHETAVTLLSDIKTFLMNDKVEDTKNKVVFLIPCDAKAISEQLRSVYRDNVDTEEFLRKFFNMSITIPRPQLLSLEKFISDKLQETLIADFQNSEANTLTFVINRAFKNNPREVIQFINILTGTYILAHKKNLRVIEQENLPFLTKVLAIQTKWPMYYELIEEKIIRHSKSFDLAVGEVIALKKGKEETGETIDIFIEFINTTSYVNEKDGNEELYFSLIQTAESEELPEWPAIISAAEDLNKDDLENILLSIENDEQKMSSLRGILTSYVQKNTGNSEKLVNVLRSFNGVLNEKNYGHIAGFLSKIFLHTKPDNVFYHSSEIETDKLLGYGFSNLDYHDRNSMLTGFVKVLGSASKEADHHLKSLYFVMNSIGFIKGTESVSTSVTDDHKKEFSEIKTEILKGFSILDVIKTRDDSTPFLHLTKNSSSGGN